MYFPPLNRLPKNQGYVLPLVIGLGTAMLILGLTASLLVQTDRKVSGDRREVGMSLAMAESGADRIMALLSQSANSPMLVRNYDPIYATTGENYLGADGIPNSGDETATAIDEWNTTNSSLMNGTIGDGTYVLRGYRYDPIQKLATLVVEGNYRQATTTIAIALAIKNESTPVAGLWIASNPDSGISGGSLQTNIQDSTPAANNNAGNVAELQGSQQPIPPASTTVGYNHTPGLAFPPLPAAAITPPSSSTPGVYAITQINNSTGTLPRTGDTPNNGVITYHVTASGSRSINLSGGNTVNLGTGAETIILYLDGGVNLSGGSNIQLAPGSKLIIYARGDVTLSGGSTTAAINNSDSISNAQLYIDGAGRVTLSGGSALRMFLFAPAAEVISSSSSNFHGVLWARSWSGSGSSLVREQQFDFAQTPVTGLPGKQSIKNIVSWKQLPKF
jgi:hypothetical protein